MCRSRRLLFLDSEKPVNLPLGGLRRTDGGEFTLVFSNQEVKPDDLVMQLLSTFAEEARAENDTDARRPLAPEERAIVSFASVRPPPDVRVR